MLIDTGLTLRPRFIICLLVVTEGVTCRIHQFIYLPRLQEIGPLDTGDDTIRVLKNVATIYVNVQFVWHI